MSNVELFWLCYFFLIHTHTSMHAHEVLTSTHTYTEFHDNALNAYSHSPSEWSEMKWNEDNKSSSSSKISVSVSWSCLSQHNWPNESVPYTCVCVALISLMDAVCFLSFRFLYVWNRKRYVYNSICAIEMYLRKVRWTEHSADTSDWVPFQSAFACPLAHSRRRNVLALRHCQNLLFASVLRDLYSSLLLLSLFFIEIHR